MNARQYRQGIQNRTSGRNLGKGAVTLDPAIDRIVAEFKVGTPAEGPIEVLLVDWLDRYIVPGVMREQQVRFPGHGRSLRVDCMLKRADVRIVLEADGHECHDATEDKIRDFELLACAGVDEVWHVPGKALVRDASAALARFVLTWSPWFREDTWKAFAANGVVAQETFKPVRNDGYYELPTPHGGRTKFYGTRRRRVAEPSKRSKRRVDPNVLF
jgi:hypothetical protein